MTKPKLLTRAIFIVIAVLTFKNSISQSNLTATLSQEGLASYRITKSGLYIYLSQRGQITGYEGIGNGSITYDYKGRVDKIGSTSISYDYKGRIDGLGSTSITYDYKSRVDKIGNTNVTYDYKERLDKIGILNVTYDYKGRVDKVGNSTITYDYKDRVDKIDDDEGVIIFRPKIETEE